MINNINYHIAKLEALKDWIDIIVIRKINIRREISHYEQTGELLHMDRSMDKHAGNFGRFWEMEKHNYLK